MWCEDEKKVPRKFAPENVHGAGIREQGEESSQPKSDAAKQAAEAAGVGSGGGGEVEASRDAAKVCGVWVEGSFPLRCVGGDGLKRLAAVAAAAAAVYIPAVEVTPPNVL